MNIPPDRLDDSALNAAKFSLVVSSSDFRSICSFSMIHNYFHLNMITHCFLHNNNFFVFFMTFCTNNAFSLFIMTYQSHIFFMSHSISSSSVIRRLECFEVRRANVQRHDCFRSRSHRSLQKMAVLLQQLHSN